MASEFVKTWYYEGAFEFTVKANSVEELAKIGTPPQEAQCHVDQAELRFIKSTVKGVNANDNKVPGVDAEDQRGRKVSKETSKSDNKSQK
jgi:hypothetical protein